MKVFCYILGCKITGQALVIDPGGNEDQIVDVAEKKNLIIKAIVNTHGHPDHNCGNARIKELTDAAIYLHAQDEAFFHSPLAEQMRAQRGYGSTPMIDFAVENGDKIAFGKNELTVIHTPGHTPGSICLLTGKHLFTGDTLFVGGIGRTDFPGGSFQTMLRSIKKRIFTLPEDTIIWPGHHYGSRLSSTVASEKAFFDKRIQ